MKYLKATPVLAILILCIFVKNAASFTITYDEIHFNNKYKNPIELIDFRSIKDGTTYNTATVQNDYINNVTHSSGGKY